MSGPSAKIGRRLAIGTAASVLGLAALWPACGNESHDEPGPDAGSGGSAGTPGAGGTGGSKAGGGAGGGTDAEMDAALDEPCAWEGWYRPPRMPAGCRRLCIPDDVSTRLPKIEWQPREDWCPGCKWLATPWAQPGERTVSPGVRATGPGVALFGLGIETPGDLGMAGWYKGDGTPVSGWRGDVNETCGHQLAIGFSNDGLMGIDWTTTLHADEQFVSRPIAQAGELMTATDTTLLFPASFKGGSIGGNPVSFSASRVALFFMGRTAIGDVTTGKLLWADELPGAPSTGQYTPGPVVDDVVFVSHYLLVRDEWWVYAGGQFKLFIGDADHDIRQFESDGKTIVWVEGTEPVQDAGELTYSKYDLYAAPFVTDPQKLAPKLLRAGIPKTYTSLKVANGFVSGVYLTQLSPGYKTAAIVVRIADGTVWHSQLPQSYNWGSDTFPAPDELWGAAVPNVLAGRAESLIRVPYSAMQVLQGSP